MVAFIVILWLMLWYWWRTRVGFIPRAEIPTIREPETFERSAHAVNRGDLFLAGCDVLRVQRVSYLPGGWYHFHWQCVSGGSRGERGMIQAHQDELMTIVRPRERPVV